MKKVISIITILVFSILPLSFGVVAVEPDEISQLAQNQNITYYIDGSYVISTLSDDSSQNAAKASTKVGSRTNSFFNSNNVLQWTVKVTGTFSYTGSTSTCTASSVSYTIYNDSWKMKSAVASKSGATAIGDFTVKYYLLLIPVQTEILRLTVKCSPSGVLS